MQFSLDFLYSFLVYTNRVMGKHHSRNGHCIITSGRTSTFQLGVFGEKNPFF
jgi:hypothetical protein